MTSVTENVIMQHRSSFMAFHVSCRIPLYLGKIALDFMACIELASSVAQKEGNNRGAARRSMDESVECRKMPLIPYYLGEKCNGQRIASMEAAHSSRMDHDLQITLRP